jgi:hypothetical protein
LLHGLDKHGLLYLLKTPIITVNHLSILYYLVCDFFFYKYGFEIFLGMCFMLLLVAIPLIIVLALYVRARRVLSSVKSFAALEEVDDN